jgi:hypothetical protein
MLRTLLSIEYTDKEKEEYYNMLRYVIRSIIVLLSLLSAGYLVALLNVIEEDIS